ncbi:sensor histidine kinase [Emcibacter nanhaiensis]|uniref:histidine kinase n=1 Tax=Emcibacter nanhaiensis TaxID=1505037 RepID=A0A501PBZ6_9PROT|nr:ATP-binding protein [Emcibacter nanhaiensis]TPD57929.1 histidine kinase [Emcibacter nanhaiensis]
MGFSNSLSALNILLRLLAILVTCLLAFYALRDGGYYVLALLLAAFAVAQLVALMRKLSATDRELTRFLDAVKYSDFSQKFSKKGQNRSQRELANAFDEVIDKFKATRSQKEQQTRYLNALVDHIPVALLSVGKDGQATLVNNAAKRLFGLGHISHITQLKAFGPGLAKELSSLRAGKKRIIRIIVDDVEVKLFLSTTEIVTGGKTQFLVSLQNIQSELDTTQLEAWQDLVHVLTHELMNSLTPVASLAGTMNSVMEELCRKAESEELSEDFRELLEDACDGIAAISRRSDRLSGFVSSYRKMTKLPPPQPEKLPLRTVLENIRTLFASTAENEGLGVEVEVSPDSLTVYADPQLLDQALINLVKNAAEATRGQQARLVRLKGGLDKSGSIIIEVADNGPGINPQSAQQIFVPFYTTRPEGTGIGLSLARQVMVAHRGSINFFANETGGTTFRLSLPV